MGIFSSFYRRATGGLVTLLLISLVLPMVQPGLLPLSTASANTNKIFPSDIGFINVTQPPYNAKGDGVTDDTSAIQQAIKAHFGTGQAKTVYFPNGTYLVSNTLEWRNSKGDWTSYILFQGQSQSGTIIRLKDNTFTNPAQPQAVIKTASLQSNSNTGSGNNAFHNSVYDMTIDTGQGNTGAIGLDYLANNEGAVQNVTIRSGDPTGVGVSGLALTNAWPGPCLIKNVTISGFNVGIDTNHYQYSVTFEHIKLSGQRVVGVRNPLNWLWFRDLRSTNVVPVIDNTHQQYRDSGVVLIDSVLTGQGQATNTHAIINGSHLYARNVQTSGYKTALTNLGQEIAGNNLTDFSSDTPLHLFDSPLAGLNLPIEETPTYFDSDMSHWKSVTAFGAVPNDGQDDTAAIQRALNSDASTIYFPTGDYHLSDTLHIGGHVKHLYGANSIFYPASRHTFTNANNPKPVFRFETPSSEVNGLLMEGFETRFTWANYNITGAVMLEDASTRPVTIKASVFGCGGGLYRNTPGVGSLFVEDVSSGAAPNGNWMLNNPQMVWARQFNPERLYASTDPHHAFIYNNGGTLWILGMKTEGNATAISTTGGGLTELLGGQFAPLSQAPADVPMLINNESSLSATFNVNVMSGSDYYNTYVSEKRDGITRTLGREAAYSERVALYVGYKAKTPLFGSSPKTGANLKLFGVTGTSLSQNLNITNLGPAGSTLSVGPAQLSGSAAAKFTLTPATGFNLAKGATQPVTIKCTAPSTAGQTYTARLTYATNDPVRPQVNYSLNCLGLSQVVVVKKTDDGSGTVPQSLSAALKNYAANQIITFALEDNATTISLSNALPPVTTGVYIDGGLCGTTPITVDGSSVNSFGLQITGKNVTIRNLKGDTPLVETRGFFCSTPA